MDILHKNTTENTPLNMSVSSRQIGSNGIDLGKTTIDEIFKDVPVAIFHYRLLFMCGLCFMADAMEVSLLYFLSTCAGAEWNLSDSKQASITGVVFGGEIIGSMFWGPLADKFGRRVTFLISSFLIASGGFLSGISPSYYWLLLFRFIVGIGVGGSYIPFDLLAEFLPVSHRGKFLINIEFFWTIGSLFIAGAAWLTLNEYGWRFLAIITAIPVSISCAISYIYLPESPRWLLIKGKPVEAKEIIINAALLCNKELPPFELATPATVQTDSNGVIIKEKTFYDLFATEDMRAITIPISIVWFVFGLTYYGFILFVGRLYTHDESKNNDELCSFNYESIFVNSSAEFVAVFFAFFVIDSWGRRMTQTSTYILGAIALFAIGSNPSAGILLFVTMLGRFALMASSCSTWVNTPELFPTEMRGTGHAFCNSGSRIGALFSPYLVISKASNFQIGMILGSLNLVAAGAAWMLPETAGKTLDDPSVIHSVDKTIDDYKFNIEVNKSLITPDQSSI